MSACSIQDSHDDYFFSDPYTGKLVNVMSPCCSPMEQSQTTGTMFKCVTSACYTNSVDTRVTKTTCRSLPSVVSFSPPHIPSPLSPFSLPSYSLHSSPIPPLHPLPSLSPLSPSLSSPPTLSPPLLPQSPLSSLPCIQSTSCSTIPHRRPLFHCI